MWLYPRIKQQQQNEKKSIYKLHKLNVCFNDSSWNCHKFYYLCGKNRWRTAKVTKYRQPNPHIFWKKKDKKKDLQLMFLSI